MIGLLAVFLFVNRAPDRSVKELSKRWAPEPSQLFKIAV